MRSPSGAVWRTETPKWKWNGRALQTERHHMAEAMVAASGWSNIVKMTALLPRLARGAVDGSYSARSGWLAQIPRYLHQIEVSD